MLGPEVAPERSALHRMRRTMYLAVGIAAVLFGALQAGGANGFIAQMGEVRAPFGVVTVVVALVMPALFAILAPLLPTRAMRFLVTATAVAFLVMQLIFVPLMIPTVLPDHAAPWFQGFGVIPAVLLAVAWGRPPIWVFPLLQGPIVAFGEYLSSDAGAQQSLLDGIGALVTCLILTGVGLAVVTAAAQQDEVAATARHQASREASLRTREREQSRINAIVHDDVMSVLLSASRASPPPALAAQARHAIETIAAVDQEDGDLASYSPAEISAAVRTTVGEAGGDFAFNSRLDSNESVPGSVVAALAEATAEAARNSVLHAGDDAHRWASVAVTPGAVEVTIRDDGQGFSARHVPERRLGLRVSIVGRMHTLPGGSADVASQPGSGTTITLRWRREGRS